MTEPLTTLGANERHPLDATLVLRGRPLRPEARLEQTARFRDDQWALGPAMLQRQGISKILDFATLPPHYRMAAKELFYTMLSGELPPGELRPAMSSVRTLFSKIKHFTDWLNDRPAANRPPALIDLTEADLVSYQRYLIAHIPNAGVRQGTRTAVRYFWRYRRTLTSDRLPFDPLHLDGWSEGRRHPRAENSADRIPESVHGPLLTWSLRFIDDFSEDILAADHVWRTLRDPARRRDARGRNSGASEDLLAFLDEQVANKCPLPGYQGRLNANLLATLSGSSRTTISARQHEVDAVVAIVGIHPGLPIPITGRLDDRPWIDGISRDPHSKHGLAVLARMLQTACYVSIAFLSGMRDSEIKHLRRGCLETQYDPDGSPYRWKVTSQAFKGEQDPAGVEATWLVGAPAARAIGVLQRLQPAGTSLLFRPLESSGGGGRVRHRTDTALTYAGTNPRLNEFVAWVNDYCAAEGRSDNIPVVNDQVWKLTTRQFRRTLAWFIARRPGGVIAGAIAYRHLSVQMFEGYAGTSDSGFRAEVEAEQALARGEHLLAMIDAHDHQALDGPAGKEAARRLEQFGEDARFQGMVVTDRHRMLRLMKRDDPAIYPGPYVTCVHKHATALCQQRRDGSGELRPSLGSCKPMTCRNVALTSENIDTWVTEIEQIDHQLAARPLLPPLLTHQLRSRRDEISKFLDRHTQQES